MSQTLKLYIPQVLSENRIVLLKGIGTLRVNYRSATINSHVNAINPPREEIYFVPSDEPDLDPILIKIVELIAKVDHDEAADLVYNFMRDLREELLLNGTITLPNIGWLKQDQWQNLFFEPAAEYISINRYFGLQSVKLPEPLTKSEQEVLADLKETAGEKPGSFYEGSITTERRWGFIIGSIFLLVVASMIYLFFPKNQDLEQEVRLMENVPIVENIVIENLSDLKLNPIFKDIGPNFLPVRSKAGKVISYDDVESGASCMIIVGAFANEKNVDRMVRRIDQSQYRSVVIEGSKLTKVGLRYDCDLDVEETLHFAKEQFDPNAWVYKELQ